MNKVRYLSAGAPGGHFRIKCIEVHPEKNKELL